MNIIKTFETYVSRDNDEVSMVSKIATYCSAAVVLLMFLNLGTVLDLQRLKSILQRPIGPFSGFCARYIIMPALAIALGRLLLQDNMLAQLGLLFAAVSPSGGFGTICTIFLKGNINLALTITMVNGLLGLAMLSFWILVVIPSLYENFDVKVPYLELSVSAVAIIAAIFFGLILRLTIPKTTRFIFRYLKPLSLFLSFALVALIVGSNTAVFKDLTFNISIAVFLLPFIGYCLSFGLSKLLCRSFTDAMTIAIETGVLSMTLPILLLSHSLTSEQTAMVLVIPIVSSLISLVLILILYFIRRLFGWNVTTDSECFDEKVFVIEM